MKAIIYHKKNIPHKLKLTETEPPLPRSNEVLVKVVAISLNAADYRSMKMGIIPKKKIFGSAISGIVEAVGENINQFKPGDAIVGDLTDFGFGGLAEYAVAPEKAFTHKPTNSSFEDSVTLPVAATTALKALRDKGNIQKGQSILIVGSTGGVGTYALQLANYFGAKVTAVCSTKNIELVKGLGAEKIIDYKKNKINESDVRYDLVVAVNGNYSLLDYKRMLSPNGTYVMVGGSLSQIFKAILFGKLLSLGKKKLKTLSAKADPKDLTFVAELLKNGHLKAIIHKRFPFEQSPKAMDYISQGHAPGKVIITI